ncbi:MAG: 1,4-beta-xylanase [Limisphaerales bacterium]
MKSMKPGPRIDCLLILAVLTCWAGGGLGAPATEGRWPEEKARAWHEKTGWLVGCNFMPSTSINQLEMWQAETFDLATIDRELGYAEGLGFNTARVFLHNLLWTQDSEGFLDRMEQFLKLAEKHHIKPIFVFFDSCWDPDPKLGRQREPKPFVHNSGWVQSPGRAYVEHPERLDELKGYVEGVLVHFRDDPRVAFWDLFNEPDNLNDPAYMHIEDRNKSQSSLILLNKVFAWSREAHPSQPVSSGVWRGNWGVPAELGDFEKVQLNESDIITFHDYGPPDEVKGRIASLRAYRRPIVCTEYMARPAGSTFDPILGIFKKEGVGACNWGFVSGKTQTIFPWDSWTKAYTTEPPLWFHDILRKDGTPYKPEEVRYIRKLTLGAATD